MSEIPDDNPGDQRAPANGSQKPLHELLRPEVLAAFDRTTFEREGYWVWKGILTDAARRQWTASLQGLQQMNDEIIMATDWAAIDWAAMGTTPPPAEKLTPEFKATCCGGSEQQYFLPANARPYMHEHGLLGPGPALATRSFASQGFLPEYFPPAYDDFFLDISSAHPQMMELLGKLLGQRFILDHFIMLNRAPGTRGRRWHAHQYLDGQYEVEDFFGNGHALTTEFLEQQCVRTLCYPEGASIAEGGELALIPGAHLYRIPYKWDIERTDGHEEMKAGWLRGKVHAFTGEPLKILELELPPGSMVSFVHHMPHYVGYRQPDAPTRWGLLLAYRTPAPEAIPARWSKGVPAHWAERQAAAGKLSAPAQRVFAADHFLA